MASWPWLLKVVDVEYPTTYQVGSVMSANSQEEFDDLIASGAGVPYVEGPEVYVNPTATEPADLAGDN